MKVIAVIAEYNPFHNGHLYQLDTIRQTLGSDYIIVVMSGDFMQRGIPAIVDKYMRCQMALENGADLVFELPVYFALGSAEYFAQGAVSLLDKLGVVDFLHFGSESGDISLLYEFTSTMLAHESDTYKAALNRHLRQGCSFPAARDNALTELFSDDARIRQLVSAPNNILGIEYIKALIQRDSTIKPVTLTRKGAGYASDSLAPDGFASANAIRKALFAGFLSPSACIRDHVPASVYASLQQEEFLFTNDFSEMLLYKMLQDQMLQDDKTLNQNRLYSSRKDAFAAYYDIGAPLSHTLCSKLPGYTTFEDFALTCKTRNLTYTRICRGLMHILLDMTQENADALKQDGYAQYARLLGFTARGKQLLGSIKANASIPILTKLPAALRQLSGSSLMSLRSDIHAADIYDSVRQQKQIRLSDTRSNNPIQTIRHNELTRQIVKHINS